MKSNIKGILTGLFLIAGTLSASAQKNNNQDLKLNIGEITNSTAKLMKLTPVTFQYDVKKYPDLKLPAGNHYGFNAADVKAEFPEFVYPVAKSYAAGKNNFKTVAYEEVKQENLIPVLVAAIKEQQEEIELLKKELRSLKDKSAE